jgi:tRNA G18 (ribose-2'-O)-methylase SpoU
MQHLQRLSGLDASFLYLETPTQPLHVCSVLELDASTIPGGYSFERLRDELALRITAIPTFREKLANSFLNLDHPVWVEDEDFDVDRHVHRLPRRHRAHLGLLEIGHDIAGVRHDDGSVAELAACLARMPVAGRDVLVAMDGITQTDNVGAIFRNAASFGARGVILSPRASDPLLRKTLRVSMGRAVNLPWARARNDEWPLCLDTLRREHGYAIIAGEDTPNAVELARFAPPAKSIVVFGAEQDGVSRAVLDMADAVVKIPMLAPGTELADALASDPPSLNVSIASAVILHHLMA